MSRLAFDKVEVKGLVKLYGPTRALAGIDLTFHAGEVTVVEGPNGSGKSTLISLVSQLARPTRGEIRYGALERDSGSARLRRHIGLLAHAPMVYPDMTGRENLELFARLYGVEDAGKRIDSLVERFEIGSWMERTARTWSRGQLQRIALARCLLHEPTLLLLDEPTTGLDVRAVERLSTVVDGERERGAILVLITHDPGLADALGDRRVRLDRGRVVEEHAA